MRKANFDISHELDEFLMVEKPLTATKRKQNVDYDKLKPEYRQLEEQSVPSFPSFFLSETFDVPARVRLREGWVTCRLTVSLCAL